MTINLFLQSTDYKDTEHDSPWGAVFGSQHIIRFDRLNTSAQPRDDHADTRHKWTDHDRDVVKGSEDQEFVALRKVKRVDEFEFVDARATNQAVPFLFLVLKGTKSVFISCRLDNNGRETLNKNNKAMDFCPRCEHRGLMLSLNDGSTTRFCQCGFTFHSCPTHQTIISGPQPRDQRPCSCVRTLNCSRCQNLLQQPQPNVLQCLSCQLVFVWSEERGLFESTWGPKKKSFLFHKREFWTSMADENQQLLDSFRQQMLRDVQQQLRFIPPNQLGEMFQAYHKSAAADAHPERRTEMMIAGLELWLLALRKPNHISPTAWIKSMCDLHETLLMVKEMTVSVFEAPTSVPE